MTQTTNNTQTISIDDLTRSLTPVILGGPSTRRDANHRTRRPLLRRPSSRVARGAARSLPSDQNRPSALR
ncbi:hypothetical protein [Ornithinimicrobium cerasi]|uniref:Uncharacterized protein n=1 Tax=Ornithinimicrobium cerasi TaxID=2248773 RepID=A0A285VPS2_9MICO|nr:hypothetical protein [Ornithinimicrobium cerasi]SOC55897.1 hypothetical protein SAMN05421879_106101 [Ornithinimicrobium cerasi]